MFDFRWVAVPFPEAGKAFAGSRSAGKTHCFRERSWSDVRWLGVDFARFLDAQMEVKIGEPRACASMSFSHVPGHRFFSVFPNPPNLKNHAPVEVKRLFSHNCHLQTHIENMQIWIHFSEEKAMDKLWKGVSKNVYFGNIIFLHYFHWLLRFWFDFGLARGLQKSSKICRKWFWGRKRWSWGFLGTSPWYGYEFGSDLDSLFRDLGWILYGILKLFGRSLDIITMIRATMEAQ